MKIKESAESNQVTLTLDGPPDFYDLKQSHPIFDEKQNQGIPYSYFSRPLKSILSFRTESELRAAAVELKRIIEPSRVFKELTTRFRELLYVLISADLGVWAPEGFKRGRIGS